LRSWVYNLPFYFRYVDDIVTAVPSNRIQDILNMFNLFHPRLQFTIEVEGNKLNFLDVTITKNKNNFEFDWF